MRSNVVISNEICVHQFKYGLLTVNKNDAKYFNKNYIKMVNKLFRK